MLPSEMMNMVMEKVRSGDYADESEVVRAGLHALLTHDRAVDRWLQSEVAPAYDALKNDPSRARSLSHIRARLAAEKNRCP